MGIYQSGATQDSIGPMTLSIKDDKTPGTSSIKKLFLHRSEGIRTKRG